MTINSTIRKVGPYIGNGSTSAFPFTFKVFQPADLEVIRLNESTGIETTLVLTTDYTVTLNLDQDSNPGGTVVLVAGPLASGYRLTLTSDLANLQPTDLTNQGGFYPDVINDALDRATIQIQQLQSSVDSSLRFPTSDVGNNGTLPSVVLRAGTLLAFDENGNPIAGPTIADSTTISENLSAIVTVADDLNGPDTIGIVASNIAAVLATPANAALAQDAVSYLQTYITQVIMNIQFPLDLGLVADPVLTNQFDLGAV